MAYIDTSKKPNPAAMLGALGVPLAAGAILATGLTVTAIIVDKPDNPFVVPITPDPIPDPPEPQQPKQQDNSTLDQTSVITSPKPVIEMPSNSPVQGLPPTEMLGDPIEFAGPIDFGPPPGLGESKASKVSPRNAPSGWVTDRDYRNNWVRRNMEGVARFSLEISASGAVSSCQITASSGHAALDEATCQLVTKRAKFEPAKDRFGEPVSSTYSNAVTWELPE